MNKFLSFFNIMNIKLFILLSKYFFIDFRTSISILRHSIKSINSVKEYSNKGYNSFCLNQLKKDKKSDTVFILGSGPSINEINKSQWNYIGLKDSWGFNFWFCHKHIPDCFFAQSVLNSSGTDPEYISNVDLLMKQMLADKKKEYETVDFYLRGDNVNNHIFHESELGKYILNNSFNCFFMPEIVVRSKSKIRPYNLMMSMFKFGFFKKNSNEMPIPKFGNTITELISLSLMYGYKKIVLCGIDMNNGGHFYDTDIYLNKYTLIRNLKVRYNKKTIHPHMDKNSKKYTTKEVIKDLNKFSMEKFNAEIFVSSVTSSLYPEIKKYEFGE